MQSYYPVIVVNAGRNITVNVTHGLSLRFRNISDPFIKVPKKPADSDDKESDKNQQQVVSQQNAAQVQNQASYGVSTGINAMTRNLNAVPQNGGMNNDYQQVVSQAQQSLATVQRQQPSMQNSMASNTDGLMQPQNAILPPMQAETE